MKCLAVFLSMFTFIFSLATSASELPKLIKSGEGEMSYLFWTIYRAELYVESLPFDEKVLPKALKIEYFRNIDSEALVDATKEQWGHLGLDEQLISVWGERLNVIWPDISEGDELIIYVGKDGESTFYSGENGETVNELGRVNDSEFGPAFLSIWLSDKTSQPELRAKLLGSLK
ncbi:chalcone isomerase family protein [uncultured Shewanella sp.]|uniref:chalcone isomerase family protein n=1 Tax=Shewanella atlantica TaxID=271099 RepID=UPI00261ADC54|nr:chalcone isomerase family protein [uncultured Shewanella sp.]